MTAFLDGFLTRPRSIVVAAAAVVAMVVTAGPAGADPTPPPAGRGFAEVLGGTTTLGLSIPGETVSVGAATIGVIAGRAPGAGNFGQRGRASSLRLPHGDVRSRAWRLSWCVVLGEFGSASASGGT